MNLFKISWKNLIAKPLSMGLSLVLVALGVSLTSILLLINQQFQDRLYRNIEGIHMVVGAKGSPLQMILSGVYHIETPTGNIPLKKTKWLKKSPYVAKAIPLALGDTYKSFRIVGTERSLPQHYKAEIKEGKFWAADMEVTIGAKVAKKLGLRPGSEFHGSHGLVGEGEHVHETYAYKVVGILQPTNTVIDQLILTNVASVWRVHEEHDHEEEDDHTYAHDTDTTAVHNHDDHDHHDHNPDTAVVVHNHTDHNHDDHGHDHDHGGELPPISEEGKNITAVLISYAKDKEGKVSVMSQMRLAETIDEQEAFQDLGYAIPAIELRRLLDNMGLGAQFLYVLALIIVFISAFSMFISLYNSMKERRYEVALMRTMGASRMKLFLMVTLEGLLIAVFGFVLGILVSHGGMMLLAGYLEDSYQYSFSGTMFLTEEIYLFFGSMFIGFSAAFIPAWQAYRTDISQTLAGA